MKSFLLVFTLTSLFCIQLIAQITVNTNPETKSVLLETFNGANCTFCPDGSYIADSSLQLFPGKLSYIEMHAGAFSAPGGSLTTDLRTNSGDILLSTIGANGFPTGLVNRNKYAGKYDLSRGDWIPKINSELPDTTPVNINVEAEYDTHSGNIFIYVALYYTSYISGAHSLNLAITQDSIITFQSGAARYPIRLAPGGNYVQMNVLRDYITPQWGERIANTSKNSLVNKLFIYTPKTINGVAPDIENMHIVAFVTKDTMMSGVLNSKTDWNIPSSVLSGSFSGTTTLNGSPMSNNTRRVYLIKKNYSSPAPLLVAVDSVDTQGSFTFQNVPFGTYYVKSAILPGEPDYSSFIPTYHTSQLLWGNADSISHTATTSGILIDMVQGVNPGGPGFIGGLVSQGANLLPGDPIPGLNIILLDGSDSPIAYTVTDQDGKYEFNNLAYGTYKVYCDILNVPVGPSIVVLSADDPIADDVDLELNSTHIGPLVINSVDPLESQWSFYPNPTSGVLNISRNDNSNDEIQVEVFSSAGKLVQSKLISKGGDNNYQIDISKEHSGLYLVKVRHNDDLETFRLLKN